MPRASHNRTLARREEIVDACEQLYRTMSFKEITLKKIGEVTSFTRTSIYNYFRTREEIFLALFEREYRLWGEDLEAILARDRLSRAEFSQELGRSLAARPNLLKLLQPEDDLKYIIVLPHISMASQLKMPKAPCLFATVDFEGQDEPEVTFYSMEAITDENAQYISKSS